MNTFGYVGGRPLGNVDVFGLARTQFYNPVNTGTGGGSTTSLSIALGPIRVNISQDGSVTLPANLPPTLGITAQISQPTTPDGANDYSVGLGIAGNGVSINEQGDATLSIGFELGFPISFGATPNELDPNRPRQCAGRPCRKPVKLSCE